MKKLLPLLVCAVLVVSLFAGCTTEQPTTGPNTSPTTVVPTTATAPTAPTEPAATQPPIEESYKYTTKSGYYLWPSMAENWVERKAMISTTADGTFYCMTADKAQANDFIVSQRTLLRYLREKGVETGELKYYATDYDDSFSESSDGAAYIALSAVRTQQQVLVTLQTLWGDYTDYGYVWALSNAIAAEMGWETAAVPTVAQTQMDAFFAANPAAVHLLYPSFATQYASQETVDCCKALAASLFEKIRWHEAIAKPVEVQLSAWHALIGVYAGERSISFSRQSIGYAYYSQHIPLRIMTQYAEHFIDEGFTNTSEAQGDIFANDSSIYATAKTLNEEICDAVAVLEVQDKVGLLPIYWISGENAARRFSDSFKLRYISATDGLYVRYASLYLSGYSRHMLAKAETNMGMSWQTNALGELIRAKSTYAQSSWVSSFRDNESLAAFFYECTGHHYGGSAYDYLESMDTLAYLEDNFGLNVSDALAGAASMGWYLVQRYGEAETYQMLLGAKDVTAVTEKTWDELASEWEQHIRDKYAHVDISDWTN